MSLPTSIPNAAPDRWNIYHILAANSSDKHLKLLKHVLEKLPEDVTQHLLIQQSKKAWNTVCAHFPCH